MSFEPVSYSIILSKGYAILAEIKKSKNYFFLLLIDFNQKKPT